MHRNDSEFGDDDEMDATHWEFDVDEDQPEVPVATVIAELEGTQGTSLSPIYETVDDLIMRLFSDPPPPEAQARIEFTYEGYRILIHQDGYATFLPTD